MTRLVRYEVRMSALLLLAAAIVPAGEAFTCTPEAVWDGDGPVWCKEGPRIRLAGIAARELDGSCSDGHGSQPHGCVLDGANGGLFYTGRE